MHIDGHFVIPAKAGIQYFRALLDPGFRRGDALEDLFNNLLARLIHEGFKKERSVASSGISCMRIIAQRWVFDELVAE